MTTTFNYLFSTLHQPCGLLEPALATCEGESPAGFPPGHEVGEAAEEDGQDDAQPSPDPATAEAGEEDLFLAAFVEHGTVGVRVGGLLVFHGHRFSTKISLLHYFFVQFLHITDITLSH